MHFKTSNENKRLQHPIEPSNIAVFFLFQIDLHRKVAWQQRKKWDELTVLGSTVDRKVAWQQRKRWDQLTVLGSTVDPTQSASELQRSGGQRLRLVELETAVSGTCHCRADVSYNRPKNSIGVKIFEKSEWLDIGDVKV